MEKGRQLGKYRLERLLGTGGMGAVWEAHDGDLDRNVALKVLRATLVGDDVAQVRLLREARAMARLRHPNVITVYDATTADGLDLVAMELIDGETMAQWLATPRRPGVIIDALLAAGRGLAAAHAAGMVHRDFKPHNVLVERGGRILVTDFGLARASGDVVVEARPPAAHTPATSPEALADTHVVAPVAPATVVARPQASDVTMSLPGTPGTPGTPARAGLEDTVDAPPADRPSSQRSGDRGSLDSPLTQTGTLLGTPAYMAPEQFAGKAADARADQFAFCVSAWEALAGTRPYVGGTMAELAAVQRAAPAAIDKIPRRLRAILTRGLAPDPAARWATMSDLLDALERAWHRPRRIASLGGATAAFGAAIVLFVATRSSPPPAPETTASCPSGRAEIGKMWSATLRGTVAQRLGPNGAPALALVDRWADAWRVVYDANCAHPSDPDFGARRACLESQRDDLGATLGLAIPIGDAARDVEVARILPSPESCQRAPRSIAPQRPTDPIKREAVIAIETELLGLRVTAMRGQHFDGGKLIAILARARALEFPPVVAEVLYVKALLAHFAVPRGGPDRRLAVLDAIETYDVAANAAEAAGHDRVRVDALLGELELAIELPDRLDGIDPLVERARGVIDRLGDPANELILDALRAQIARARGEWSAAISLAYQAQAGWLARGGTDTVARLALFEASTREARHAPGDLETARARYADVDRLALQPSWHATLRRAAGDLAWRVGDLPAARALIVDNTLLAGGGDRHGGTIAGSISGLGVGTLVDPATDDARAARTSLPTIAITRIPAVEGLEPWQLPVGEGGAWTFDHVPPGSYVVAASVDTSLGDHHVVRARVDVVAGRTTTVALELGPRSMAAVTWEPRTEGIAVLLPRVAIASSAALRARLATAGWSTVSEVSAGGRRATNAAWIGHLTRGPGPATACLVAGAELAGDLIVPRSDDPPPICKDVP